MGIVGRPAAVDKQRYEGLPSLGPPAVRAGVVRQLLQPVVSGKALNLPPAHPGRLLSAIPARSR